MDFDAFGFKLYKLKDNVFILACTNKKDYVFSKDELAQFIVERFYINQAFAVLHGCGFSYDDVRKEYTKMDEKNFGKYNPKPVEADVDGSIIARFGDDDVAGFV